MVGHSGGFATTAPLMRKEVEHSLKTNSLYVLLTTKLSLQLSASSDPTTVAGEFKSPCNLGGGLWSVDEKHERLG